MFDVMDELGKDAVPSLDSTLDSVDERTDAGKNSGEDDVLSQNVPHVSVIIKQFRAFEELSFHCNQPDANMPLQKSRESPYRRKKAASPSTRMRQQALISETFGGK